MSRLQANQRRAVRPEHCLRSRRLRRWATGAIPVLMVMLVATACVDDSGNRQFATDPRTPRPTAQATLATPADATPIVPARSQASPEALVDRRGAPRTIYADLAGTLWSFTGAEQHKVREEPYVAFDASPSGHRVAIVTMDISNGEATYGIEILTPEGEVEERYDEVLTSPVSESTPTMNMPADAGVYLSWSPQGRRLLLAHPSGKLIDIMLDGDVQEVETRSSIEGVVQADWSPRGDTIGVIIRDEEGNGALGLIDPSQDPAPVNIIAPVGDRSGNEKSVEQFAWKAQGDGVLFLEGHREEHGVTGGKIVSWDQSSNSTRIVATGGQGGPTGSISSFEIAPDGKAVVYSISLLTGDGWSFNGLYVRSLIDGQVYRVPVGPEASVLDAWWIADGLAVAVNEDSTEPAASIAIQVIDQAGQRERIGTVTIATPAIPGASPVVETASPVASPVTPAGTPEATPSEATPVATPVRATPAP